MRVQLEIKMADVKPETLKPDIIADGIHMKFQQNLLHRTILVGRLLVQDDVRVGEKLKMAS